MVLKSLLGPRWTPADGFALAMECRSQHSIAKTHHDPNDIRTSLLRLALQTWVFHTDKLLQLQSRWRVMLCSFPARKPSYRPLLQRSVSIQEKADARLQSEMLHFFTCKARADRALLDELQETDHMLDKLRKVAKKKQSDLLAIQPEKDQIMDCTLIRFCTGPCSSTIEETFVRFLNPYSGERYASLIYLLRSGVKIEIRNARLCAWCYERFMELHSAIDNDPDARAIMHFDALAVRRKLLSTQRFASCPPPT
jgi:hypothetical protein